MHRILVLIAAMAMVVAACGGGDDSGSTDTQAPATTTATAQGGDGGGDAAKGQEVFTATCSACHGPNGEGVEGLGKPFQGSTFVAERTDQEMLDFLLVGRPADHEDNTTGIAMLPRGGNPSLTDADLLDVIAFLRTLF